MGLVGEAAGDDPRDEQVGIEVLYAPELEDDGLAGGDALHDEVEHVAPVLRLGDLHEPGAALVLAVEPQVEGKRLQTIEAELADPLIKYGPPAGLLLLAYWNNDVAGCIALRKLNQPGHCEMKRLYVRPDFRKNKIGEKLAMELLTAAKEKGYTLMRLDTLYKLQPAIHLYEKLGFRKTEPYYLIPLPEVVYMEKSL